MFAVATSTRNESIVRNTEGEGGACRKEAQYRQIENKSEGEQQLMVKCVPQIRRPSQWRDQEDEALHYTHPIPLAMIIKPTRFNAPPGPNSHDAATVLLLLYDEASSIGPTGSDGDILPLVSEWEYAARSCRYGGGRRVASSIVHDRLYNKRRGLLPPRWSSSSLIDLLSGGQGGSTTPSRKRILAL